MAYPYTTLTTGKGNSSAMENDHPNHHNAMAAALNDLKTELGNNPSGAYGTLTQRLAALQSVGYIRTDTWMIVADQSVVDAYIAEESAVTFSPEGSRFLAIYLDGSDPLVYTRNSATFAAGGPWFTSEEILLTENLGLLVVGGSYPTGSDGYTGPFVGVIGLELDETFSPIYKLIQLHPAAQGVSLTGKVVWLDTCAVDGTATTVVMRVNAGVNTIEDLPVSVFAGTQVVFTEPVPTSEDPEAPSYLSYIVTESGPWTPVELAFQDLFLPYAAQTVLIAGNNFADPNSPVDLLEPLQNSTDSVYVPPSIFDGGAPVAYTVATNRLSEHLAAIESILRTLV